jgi:hypothetical protein
MSTRAMSKMWSKNDERRILSSPVIDGEKSEMILDSRYAIRDAKTEYQVPTKCMLFYNETLNQ